MVDGPRAPYAPPVGDTPAPVPAGLLPARSTGSDELEVAVRVPPGGEPAGEWHDVLDLGAGRLGLVLGVVHGVPEVAVAAAQLRTAVRACARVDLSPAELLVVLDALVAEAGGSATCAYAVHDPEGRSLEIAAAGAPPPVVRSASGGAQVVALRAGPALGRGARPQPARVPLPAGSVLAMGSALLLGTAPAEQGVLALAGAVVGGEQDLARLASGAAARLGGGTLLLARVPADVDGRSTAVVVPVPRDRQRVAEARDRVQEVARRWALVPEVADAAGQLAHELVANALVHSSGTVELRLRLTRDRLVVAVHDGDGELPHRRAARDDDEAGRGLALVEALSTRWGARHVDAGGKLVWAELDLAGS